MNYQLNARWVLKWNTEPDCFRFSVYSHQTPESTKRGVLSRLSTVFDPLGVLAPYMLPAKCLIQSLWRKNKGWDEPLDEADQSIWKDWLEDLMRLSWNCLVVSVLTRVPKR